MNLSRPFITRPIATTLLTLGLALAGLAAYFVLLVARLPNVNQPVITVSASLAGASPADYIFVACGGSKNTIILVFFFSLFSLLS